MVICTNRLPLVFYITLFFTANTFSQKGNESHTKYGKGNDSIQCISNLSLYREYVRLNENNLAFPYWKKVFNDCPASTKNIYIDGAKIYRNRIQNASNTAQRSERIDTLMLIYNQRLVYFDDRAEVRGRQGVDLYNLRKGDGTNYMQQAYGYLSEAINLGNIQTPPAVLVSFVSVTLDLYKSKLIDTRQVLYNYNWVTIIINKQLVETNGDKKLKSLKLNIDAEFINSGVLKCEEMNAVYIAEINTAEKDTILTKFITQLLVENNCSEISLTIFDTLNITNKNAEKCAISALSEYKAGNYTQAITFYQQAFSWQEIAGMQADYCLAIAVCYYKLNDKKQSRDFARKAAILKPNWGEPYIHIGQLYAGSESDCSSSTLPKSVYWVAVDQFNKAKSVDTSVIDKANKLISTYLPYYPNKEEAFFYNVTEGNTFVIGCWINENTKARFNP